MADEAYMSYEQVLQELQVNRSELNRLIRDGRLKDHVISGETKFRRVEVTDLKKTLQKRPTVMAEEGGAEPTTDVLLAGAAEAGGPGEPETEILEGEPVDRETDVLAEQPSPLQERDTEVLEEEGKGDLALEMPGDEDLHLEKPLAEATPLSESALETDLELQAVRAKPAPEEEEFFDFTDALKEEDFELEGAEATKIEAPKAQAPKTPAPKAQAPRAPARSTQADELVGDILGLEEEAAGGQVSEEELLSEIMEIEGAEESEEDTADITADITTMEEPTYEATELEDVLAGGKAEEPFGDEFAVPIPEAVGPEAQATAGMVAMLVIALVILIIAGLFVVDNGGTPGFTGGLTSWAVKL
jgi:hypothetical protein